MKIKDLLKIESNYDNNEKKIILSFLFNCKLNDLYLINEVDNTIIKKYQKMIKSDLPVQYLINNASFLNNDFFVNKDVLIPRFETEQLVIDTNELINQYFSKPINIIDIATGSGCIAISLKKLNNNNNLTATDISNKALKIAKKNAKKLKTDINFIKSDIHENINDKYYIIILKEASEILNKQSIIAFEIGYDQKEDINKIINKYFPKSKIVNKKDLNGFDRYIYIINNFE